MTKRGRPPSSPGREKIKRHFGEHLRGFRTTAGLTQSALAGRTGLSEKYISRIESGEALPSVEVALRLASELDVSVEEIAGEEEIKDPPHPALVRLFRLLRRRSPEEIEKALRAVERLLK